MDIKLDFSLVVAVYLFLFVFGLGFNLFVTWLERKRYLEGYAAIVVAVGVAVTVGVMAVVNWQFALLIFGAFAASGLPMLAGSIWRHMKQREFEQLGLRMDVTPGKFGGGDKLSL